MSKLTDKFGRYISEGDWVLYPGRQGSRCWLTLAMVEAIQTDDEGKPCALTVVVVGDGPVRRAVVRKTSEMFSMDITWDTAAVIPDGLHHQAHLFTQGEL